MDSVDESDSVVSCPTCSREDFSNEAGMKVHHKRKHGESISGVKAECGYCGNGFRVQKKRVEGSRQVFCPDSDCYGKWRSENLVGKASPTYTGGKKQLNCEWCGKEVYRYEASIDQYVFCSDPMCFGAWVSENRSGENHPSYNTQVVKCEWCGEEVRRMLAEVENYQRHFCGDKDCQAKWQSENWIGENSPNWQGGPVEVECSWCGEDLRVKKAIFRMCEDHFCPGGECYAEFRSVHWAGEGGPNWQGGYEGDYGPKWTKQRNLARIRDEYSCQSCAVSEGTHSLLFGYGLDVHHKVPFKNFEESSTANELSNLLTLCRRCHLAVEKHDVEPGEEAAEIAYGDFRRFQTDGVVQIQSELGQFS
jgi:hypothetical protein